MNNDKEFPPLTVADVAAIRAEATAPNANEAFHVVNTQLVRLCDALTEAWDRVPPPVRDCARRLIDIDGNPGSGTGVVR